jgi:hypothetical protein
VYGIKHYGFALFYTITADTNLAVHYEKDITGFNCQTNVWHRDDGAGTIFTYGETEDITTINTEAEQDFWIGRNEGRLTNGMDTLLSDTPHSAKLRVRNITGINNIERSCYLHGSNIDAFGLYDKGSLSGAHVKDANSLKANNVVRGITAIDTKNTASTFGYYGQNNAVFKDLVARQLEGSLSRIIAVSAKVARTVSMSFDGGSVTNGATGFYLTNDTRLENLNVSNYEFINVRSGSQRAAVIDHDNNATMDIGKIKLENVTHTLDKSITGLLLQIKGYAFKNCDEVIMRGCTGVSRDSPFECAGVTYADIENCTFDVRSDQAEQAAFNAMRNDALFTASKFDFKVNLIGVLAAASNKTLSIRMFRRQEFGMVNCADYWSDMNIGFAAPDNTAYAENLVDLGDFNVHVSAYHNGDSIEFDYDGDANVTTNVVIVGSFFSNTDSTKHRVTAVGGPLTLITTSTTLIGGDISLRVTRL